MPSVAEARPLSSASTGQRAERNPLTTPAATPGKANFFGYVTSPAGLHYEVHDNSTARRTYLNVFLNGELVRTFAGYPFLVQAIKNGELDEAVRRPACADEDPELFFPISETGLLATKQIEEAKAVCRRCPLVAACRDSALGEEFGIWGGLSKSERRALKRREARPRTAGVAA